MRMRLVGVVALWALLAVSCGGGNPEATGPSEGIQVHGDWTIDIYNPDGTLDERVEFSNALTTEGEAWLVNLLTGTHSASGLWSVRFGEDLGVPSGPCPVSFPGSKNCEIIVQAAEDQTGRSIELVGSTAVEADGFIGYVQTFFGACDGTVAPADCAENPSAEFTYRVLDALVPVSVDQTVQLEVVISFSAG